MQKKDGFTKFLAIAGTILACIPILMTLLTMLASPFIVGRFMMDYLIPAELGLFFYAGAFLLLWAAFRMHDYRGLIGGGLIAALAFILGVGVAASAFGLDTMQDPGGWQLAFVMTLIALYIVAQIVIDVAGILLSLDLFRSSRPSAGGAAL